MNSNSTIRRKSKRCTVIQDIDMLGIPISLRFKGDQKFKSTLGGVISMISLACILGYFLFLAKDVWNFKTTVKNSIDMRNLAFDTTKVELTPDIFDFAVGIQY
jgi:hypothetical protein